MFELELNETIAHFYKKMMQCWDDKKKKKFYKFKEIEVVYYKQILIIFYNMVNTNYQLSRLLHFILSFWQ